MQFLCLYTYTIKIRISFSFLLTFLMMVSRPITPNVGGKWKQMENCVNYFDATA